MMNTNELVPVNKPRPGAEPEDMFADLPELDPFELKKDEVAAQLAALMSFARKNRSSMAESLRWKKSRITSVLSGKGNPTIKTIWDFCSALGYDFDVVFRSSHGKRASQPWHRRIGVSEVAVHQNRQPDYETKVEVQTAFEVASDLISGNAKAYYLSIETSRSPMRVIHLGDSGPTAHLEMPVASLFRSTHQMGLIDEQHVSDTKNAFYSQPLISYDT